MATTQSIYNPVPHHKGTTQLLYYSSATPACSYLLLSDRLNTEQPLFLFQAIGVDRPFCYDDDFSTGTSKIAPITSVHNSIEIWTALLILEAVKSISGEGQ